MTSSRPSLALLGAEPFRVAIELASHRLANYGTAEPGDGHAVVSFPDLVAGNHIGMGWNRNELAVVAGRLVQPPGPWRPSVCAQ